MPIRNLSRLIILSGLVGFTSGCSGFLVKGPPSGHETMSDFWCTESRGLAVMDGIVGGLFLLTALDEAFSSNPLGIGAESAAIGALYGTSSWVGFRRVSDCRAAKEELARRSGELARHRDPED